MPNQKLVLSCRAAGEVTICRTRSLRCCVEKGKSSAMSDAVTEELLQLNRRLLDSIAQADWATYEQLSEPTLTAFEPEALGQLVEGLEFHHFYFKLGGVKGESHTTMIAPKVRVMGDMALVAYVRLNQQVSANGVPMTMRFEETRVWQRQDGQWRQVHFHRSAL